MEGKTALSSEAAPAWIKHRADLELRVQSPSPLHEVSASQVHPAQRVQQQGEEWTRKWQTPTTPPDCLEFEKLLQDIPSHPTCQVDLEPSHLAPSSFARPPCRCANVRLDRMDGPVTCSCGCLPLGGSRFRPYGRRCTAKIPSLWQRSFIVLLDKGPQRHSSDRLASSGLASRGQGHFSPS